VEAMTMGDRVAVLRGGVLQQTGDPQAVFDRPVNLFVASFIGSPPMNLVQAGLAESGDVLIARIGGQELTVPPGGPAARPRLPAYAGRRVGLGIRPEHLHEPHEHGANGDGQARLRGTISATEALGTEFLVHVEITAEPVITDEVLEVAGDVDAAVLERLEAAANERRPGAIARLALDRRPGVDATNRVGGETRRAH